MRKGKWAIKGVRAELIVLKKLKNNNFEIEQMYNWNEIERIIGRKWINKILVSV